MICVFFFLLSWGSRNFIYTVFRHFVQPTWQHELGEEDWLAVSTLVNVRRIHGSFLVIHSGSISIDAGFVYQCKKQVLRNQQEGWLVAGILARGRSERWCIQKQVLRSILDFLAEFLSLSLQITCILSDSTNSYKFIISFEVFWAQKRLLGRRNMNRRTNRLVSGWESHGSLTPASRLDHTGASTAMRGALCAVIGYLILPFLALGQSAWQKEFIKEVGFCCEHVLLPQRRSLDGFECFWQSFWHWVQSN